MLDDNRAEWDEQQQAEGSHVSRRKRLMVLAAACLIGIVLGAGGVIGASFLIQPSLQDRADRIVEDVQAVQTEGCEVVIPKGIFPKGTPREYAEKAVTQAQANSKMAGADATAGSLKETGDGRLAGVAVGIRCP